jgi:hypothetical protein
LESKLTFCAISWPPAAMHGARFGLTGSEALFPFRRDLIRAIAPKAALMDAGVAWLMDRLEQAAQIALPQ